jgi:hypothetical protein
LNIFTNIFFVIKPYAFVYFADANGYYTALNQGSILVEGINVRIEMPHPRRYN